jgi:hypothetical protein
MRKGIRITPDAALTHTIEDLARRESRPVANMCIALIKSAIEQRRAQQRPAERNEQPPRS